MIFRLATSAKNTERSFDARILSRDLLKKRNLLLTLLVILILWEKWRLVFNFTFRHMKSNV